MPGRNFEEIPYADLRLDTGFHHADHEFARDAVAGVPHWARLGRAEQRLLVGLPGPPRLENRTHSCPAISHLDDGDASAPFHFEKLAGRLQRSYFYPAFLHAQFGKSSGGERVCQY